MKFATMFVIALLSCALGAVACAVSGFLGFIGGIALTGQSEDGPQSETGSERGDALQG